MLKITHRKIKKSLASAGLLSLEFLFALIIFLGAIFLFSFLAKEVIIEGDKGFDERAFQWVSTLVSHRINYIMEAISFLGNHKFLIPANLLLCAYFLFVRKHAWYSIKVASIALSSVTLMFVLKLIFARMRPNDPLLAPALGYSFPSGHSLVSFTFYGLLIYLVYNYAQNVWVKWGSIIFFSCLILMIGFSRIYLRVHYATDVLAGFLIGIAWLLFSLYFLNRMEQYSQRRLHESVMKT